MMTVHHSRFQWKQYMRGDLICAAGFIILFFFPWIDVHSQVYSGYTLPLVPRSVGSSGSLFHLFCLSAYLIPILSLLLIIKGVKDRSTTIISTVTGVFSLIYLLAWSRISIYHFVKESGVVSKTWRWITFREAALEKIEVSLTLQSGAILLVFTAILLLGITTCKRFFPLLSRKGIQPVPANWSRRFIRIIFGEWNENRLRQITGLLLGIVAILCFSFWKVPALWQGAPSWLHWAIMPFGVDWIIRFPAVLATILSLMIILALTKWNIIDCRVDSLFDILGLLINIWMFALALELVIGRTDRFLEGGIIVLVLVAFYALAMLSVRQIVPFALTGLFLVILFQLVRAEQKLYIPGFFGVMAMFLSLVLQFQQFLPRLLRHASPISGETGFIQVQCPCCRQVCREPRDSIGIITTCTQCGEQFLIEGPEKP